jgi:centromeric protein E
MEKAVQRSLHVVDVGADMSADASFSSSSGLDSDHTQDADTVTVHLRLRPLPPDEPSAWVASPLTSSVALQPAMAYGRSSGLGNHNFDAVHVGSSNDDLYKSLARPLVSSVLSGFNALIFAYGQTASGKTFTLSGDDKSGAEGITQMAVKDLFRGIRSSKREREWLVRCSWIEVYNEAVKDLLDPNNIPQIRSSTSKGTFVAPLAEIIVTSPASIFDLLEQGQKHRHVNATDWNERSSRSHTAFKIVVESWARDDSAPSAYVDEDGSPRPASPTKGKKVRVSELVLVDLAGSEKYVTKGGQERRAEGANINKSLLTLGKVIFALSEKPSSSSGMVQQQHIPYRDSKLTRILQNSLSGNSKIAVVATLNQTTASIEESLSTIMFAKRIKKVQLSAQLNEVDAPESSGEAQALLVKYRREADDLRRLVRELQDRDRTRGSADATVNDVGGAATQEYIEQVEERLKVLGSCVVRGEGLEDFDDHDGDEVGDATTAEEAVARTGRLRGSLAPINRPATPSHLDFTISTAALRQQLHAATRRITSLEAKGASSSPQQKDELIAKLQSQLLEAEIALEATALQPLPKVREDVEAEFLPRIAQLEKELRESRELNEECVRECERLQKVNQRLVALAHKETSELVGRLKEEAQSPVKDQLKSRGTGSGVGLTPTIRRLKEAGEGVSGAGSPRERPKSVLGDMGMRISNTIDSGASPSSFVNSSPLKHKASARALLSATPPKASLASAAPASTARRGAKIITTSSSSSSSRGRRSASHDFSLTLNGATSLSAGAGAGTRKKSHLFKMAGGGRADLDSDEENADESALLDF